MNIEYTGRCEIAHAFYAYAYAQHLILYTLFLFAFELYLPLNSFCTTTKNKKNSIHPQLVIAYHACTMGTRNISCWVAALAAHAAHDCQP